ncbi:kelch repeat-containing protein [Dyadobacter sandarakinus]|uniref:Cadherin domain-containing protein n=1 Tax=Dyadobacter sandarakinus TaxID=2747268 RepID=A0ABX7I3V2_9BACT|nr:kelch repeat-containing protein [Dyadobacter sandarakinus]QRR00555.1 hypothetical protein HWI92_06370 [Dyadobacter sandarakinus]
MIEKFYLPAVLRSGLARYSGLSSRLFFKMCAGAIVCSPAVNAQDCLPNSTLPCDSVRVALPFRLTFAGSVPNSIQDAAGAGTGFRMVQHYTGSRLAADGAVANASFPAYLPSKLLVTGGQLKVESTKGIAYLDNNNQLNTLGVQVDARNELEIVADLINPFNGSQDEQAGIWFGLGEKTYIKLVVTENRFEFRRELNDLSNKTTGTSNPDQRQTGVVSGLGSKTVRLRMVINPETGKAAGYYSTNGGASYSNVGAAYAAAELSIADMGLTGGSAYAGLFATHRNGSKPVNYYFDNFGVSRPLYFDASRYDFEVVDSSPAGSQVGSVRAGASGGSPVSYQMIAGNTNGMFSLNASSGALTTGKRLNHHSQQEFRITIVASSGTTRDTTTAVVRVNGQPVPEAFTNISWTTTASQPYRVSEAQGEVVGGRLYSFGGFDTQKVKFTPTFRSYMYDPASNKWTAIANLPHTPNGANYGGVTHAGVGTDGTDIYFAGGYTSNADGTGQTFGVQQVWKYNVSQNTYSKLPDLPIRIAAGQLEYVAGKLHHIAGTNAARTQDLGNHYVLDLDNLAAGWKTLAPLPTPRQHAGTAVFEGKIYYIGGQTGHDEKLATRKDVHCYDPATNTWTKMADLPAPGTYGLGHISSSVVIAGNRLIVMGGETQHGTSVGLVSAYSPATNTWESLTPLPAGRYSGVAAYLNGMLFYTGGSKTNTTYKGIVSSPAGTTARVAAELPQLFSTERKLVVFPNPAVSGNISVQLENFAKNESVKVYIVNAFGKTIASVRCITDENGHANTTFRNAISLPNQTYMIKAEGAQGNASGRILVP